MKTSLWALAARLCLSSAGMARAEGVANLGLFYTRSNVATARTPASDGNGNYVLPATNHDVTTLEVDLLLGYQFGNGAIVGLQYLQQEVVYSNAYDTASGTASGTSYALGPSVGWIEPKGGFGAVLSLLLMPTYSASLPSNQGYSRSSLKLTGTFGSCGGAGYLFAFGEFRVGPWLDYESVTYTKAVVSGEPSFVSSYSPGQDVRASGRIPKQTVTTTSPMIVFGMVM